MLAVTLAVQGWEQAVQDWLAARQAALVVSQEQLGLRAVSQEGSALA